METCSNEKNSGWAGGALRERKGGFARWEERVLAQAATSLVTFPKYLLLNAQRFRDCPAMRHKDFGIWQSWTWAEQLDEIRAFAIAGFLGGYTTVSSYALASFLFFREGARMRAALNLFVTFALGLVAVAGGAWIGGMLS